MYLMYIAAIFLAAVINMTAGRTVEPTFLERRAEAVLEQMHYYHMAAFQEFEGCMRTATCSAGVVDVTDLLDEAMEDAAAFSSGRYVSFINPSADVSDSPMNGILVTLWVEGDEEPVYGGRAFAGARAKENSYYIAGRAERTSGSTYEIALTNPSNARSPLRLDEARFSLSGLGIPNRDRYLAYYSAGVNIY